MLKQSSKRGAVPQYSAARLYAFHPVAAVNLHHFCRDAFKNDARISASNLKTDFSSLAVSSDLERLKNCKHQNTIAVKKPSNNRVYIALTLATFKSLIFNWIRTVHDYETLQRKDLKNHLGKN